MPGVLVLDTGSQVVFIAEAEIVYTILGHPIKLFPKSHTSLHLHYNWILWNCIGMIEVERLVYEATQIKTLRQPRECHLEILLRLPDFIIRTTKALEVECNPVD